MYTYGIDSRLLYSGIARFALLLHATCYTVNSLYPPSERSENGEYTVFTSTMSRPVRIQATVGLYQVKL